jgi:hypothetical protein
MEARGLARMLWTIAILPAIQSVRVRPRTYNANSSAGQAPHLQSITAPQVAAAD